MAGHPDQRWGGISYAQHGDDFMILNLFELIGIKGETYLDIGAHHPKTISNTALLYEKGWRGVNVEANPNLIHAFKVERPRDITVNVGVAAQAGTLPFFMHHAEAGRNTFDPKERDQLIAEGHPVLETKMIAVVTINDLVGTYFGGIWPDLVSIDAEGFDIEIIESARFMAQPFHHVGPKVIVIEIRRHDTLRMIQLMIEKGYYLYCRMGENLFFVDEQYEIL